MTFFSEFSIIKDYHNPLPRFTGIVEYCSKGLCNSIGKELVLQLYIGPGQCIEVVPHLFVVILLVYLI